MLRAEQDVLAGLELLAGERSAGLQRRAELRRSLLDVDVVDLEAAALPLELDLATRLQALEVGDVEVRADGDGRRLLLRLGRAGEGEREEGGGDEAHHWTTISPFMSLPCTAQ
jgi:hypothetical protein